MSDQPQDDFRTGVRIVRPPEFDTNTPQTSGLTRGRESRAHREPPIQTRWIDPVHRS